MIQQNSVTMRKARLSLLVNRAQKIKKNAKASCIAVSKIFVHAPRGTENHCASLSSVATTSCTQETLWKRTLMLASLKKAFKWFSQP